MESQTNNINIQEPRENLASDYNKQPGQTTVSLEINNSQSN